MMPSTWKRSWKLAHEIRASWQQEEPRNDVPNLDSFSVDRPHRKDGFLEIKGPKNDAFDLEKTWKLANKIRASWQQEEPQNDVPNLDSFSVDRPHRKDGFLGIKGPKNDAFDLKIILETGPRNSGFLAAGGAPK